MLLSRRLARRGNEPTRTRSLADGGACGLVWSLGTDGNGAQAMSDQPEFLIEAEDLGGGVTLVRTTATEIRHPGTAAEIGDEIRSLIARGLDRLVLDLSHTRYMSSSGFAALLNVARRLTEQGGKIAIGRIHPDVLVGSRIIGLDHLIPIHEDLRTAETAVRAD